MNLPAGAGTGSDEVAELYHATYARLVRTVCLVADNREEAEEAVQEAFARLIVRWPSVRNYDDPEAWVRKVAFRLVSKRRRALRTALRLGGETSAASQPEPSAGDAVDIHRALLTLPLAQRQVLVLFHFLDYDVNEIAHQLQIPTGTVKSRLFRGRSALSALLDPSEDHDA